MWDCPECKLKNSFRNKSHWIFWIFGEGGGNCSDTYMTKPLLGQSVSQSEHGSAYFFQICRHSGPRETFHPMCKNRYRWTTVQCTAGGERVQGGGYVLPRCSGQQPVCTTPQPEPEKGGWQTNLKKNQTTSKHGPESCASKIYKFVNSKLIRKNEQKRQWRVDWNLLAFFFPFPLNMRTFQRLLIRTTFSSISEFSAFVQNLHSAVLAFHSESYKLLPMAMRNC